MKGLVNKGSIVKNPDLHVSNAFRNVALATGVLATIGIIGCNKAPDTVSLTGPTTDTTQTNPKNTKTKITIPPGLDLGASLVCGSSVSNCVTKNTVSLFGNVALMLDSVSSDSAGKDISTSLNVIGRDSASYVVYKKLDLTPHNTTTLDIGLDSVSITIDTIYGPASVNVTVTKMCSGPEGCKSQSAYINCANPTVLDTMRLGQTMYAGQFPIVLNEIIDVDNGTKVVSDHSVRITLLRNDCSVAATATINERQSAVIQVGIYSLVIKPTVITEIHTANSTDSSYAVMQVSNICPQ